MTNLLPAGHTAESSSSVSEDQEEATSGDANQAAADSSIPCQPSSGQASLAEARQLLDAEHYGLDKVCAVCMHRVHLKARVPVT